MKLITLIGILTVQLMFILGSLLWHCCKHATHDFKIAIPQVLLGKRNYYPNFGHEKIEAWKLGYLRRATHITIS